MTSAADEITRILDQFGPVGTVLAVAAVPVVASIAGVVTRMASQSRIDNLKGELERLKAANDAENERAEQKYASLEERYQSIRRSGALIQSQIEAIAGEIEEIAARLDANDYSVLVPAPTSIPGDEPDALVFLCASGDQAAKLKWIRVPLQSSFSGQVFLSGKSTIASPPSTGDTFSRRTDKITDIETNEALSVCLRYRGNRVGVAQFLNRRNSMRFDSDDRERAETQCMTLAIRVADFLSDPRRLVELGHAPRQNRIDATIMFVDLSNYSDLFHTLDHSVIADILNQYLQDLCRIALRHGAAIDQVIGDGVMLTFNVGDRQADHQAASLAAAIEMRAAFRALRERWTTVGYGGAKGLYVRFGLSCGSLTRAAIGHFNAARLTVIGPAVNAAAHACQLAPRDRDVILVTREFKEQLTGDVKWAGTSPELPSNLHEVVE